MQRRIPNRAAPELEGLTPPESFTVRLRTVTPMFGGSAKTGEVDPRFPVRAASVRGQLHFWWRATAGARFETPRALFEAESALFGSAEKPGPVRVEVRILSPGRAAEPVRHERKNGKMTPKFPGGPAYALFPFQGTIDNGVTENLPARAREGVEFEVLITGPEQLLPELQTALSAWVLLGGIGSRTRRGCGSLQVVGGTLGRLPRIPAGPPLLTTLPEVYVAGEPMRDALAAWTEAVNLYRDFRQGEGVGRREGRDNRPGRSYYPEPDTIRDITRRYGHDTIHPVRGFPRADLGLPIIFHFQDRGRGEPSDQTLQGKQQGKQRFASPVITKAAFIRGEWRPLIAVLRSPHVWQGYGVELKGQRDIRPGEINLRREELDKIRPLQGAPIREALLDFAREEGYENIPMP